MPVSGKRTVATWTACSAGFTGAGRFFLRHIARISSAMRIPNTTRSVAASFGIQGMMAVKSIVQVCYKRTNAKSSNKLPPPMKKRLTSGPAVTKIVGVAVGISTSIVGVGVSVGKGIRVADGVEADKTLSPLFKTMN